MPTRPPHPCSYRGCAALTNERYCAAHEDSQRKRYAEEHPREDAFYESPAWRKLRGAYAKTHQQCADPFGDHARAGQVALMKVVDHIIPRAQGGKDVWENLQPLCNSCHSRKSALEGSRWGVSK